MRDVLDERVVFEPKPGGEQSYYEYHFTVRVDRLLGCQASIRYGVPNGNRRPRRPGASSARAMGFSR